MSPDCGSGGVCAEMEGLLTLMNLRGLGSDGRRGEGAHVSSISEQEAETKTWQWEDVQFLMKVHLCAFGRARAADERNR